MGWLRPRIRRDTLLRAGSWFVLIFVLAPSIFYMGHWNGGDEGHVHAAGYEHVPPTDAASEHELHCHTGPASCGGESLVGSLWVGEDAGLLAFDSEPREEPGLFFLQMTELLPSRILQPPRPLT